MPTRTKRVFTRRLRITVAILFVLGLVGHPAFAQQPAGTLTKPPKLTKFVPAQRPTAETDREAKVTLQVDIGADGKVAAAQVTGSAGQAFDDAALAAVKQFEFEPAEIDGKPAAVRIVYEYQFTIETKIEAKTTAELAGKVRERGTNKPLAGVTVALDTGATTTTADDGTFRFDNVPPGARTVTLSSTAITSVHTQETLDAGKRLDVVYEVALQAAGPAEDADDLEIVVSAPKLEKAAASVAVTAGVARRVPGTGGDVIKVVESMPGVARAPAGSGQLVVWGAAPDDTRVYVDGVRIPRLYHAGGFRSVIAADLVKNIELVPGGWGVAHGRSLGGLVDISLVPLDDKSHAAVAVDALDSAGVVRIPVARDVSLALAGRKSHLGWLLDRFSDEDVGELVPIPSYLDGQARLSYKVSPRARIEAGALGSSDRVTRNVASKDPAATRSDQSSIDFWRAWSSYHHTARDGAESDTVVYAGRDRTRRVERFGALPTELDVAGNTYGLRTSWRRTSGRVGLAIGLDTEIIDFDLERRGAVTVPAREGDIRVFGQPPPDQLAVDQWGVVVASAAPYIQADVALVDRRLHLIPGLRLEPFFVSVSRRTPIAGSTPSVGLFSESTTIQPRFAARFDLTERVRLNAAIGRYHQPPQPEDLSAVFGDPTLPISTATHVVAGIGVKWTQLVSTELTGFATRSHDLAVRSPSADPRLAQALEPIGTGRTIGVQALVRRELGDGVFGWISYTLSKAERVDMPGAPARRFDFDQTHVLAALVSWDVGRGVEIGARARYATGAPRTAVIGSYYDNRTDQFQPMFGEHNGDRLPAFVQLDARIAKRLRVARSDGEIYLDLQNVTNRANAEELVYSTDFATRSTIRGLPILPVAGARWAW